MKISDVPVDFRLLADNDACVQAIRHRKRPLYGVQFHRNSPIDGTPTAPRYSGTFLRLRDSKQHLGRGDHGPYRYTCKNLALEKLLRNGGHPRSRFRITMLKKLGAAIRSAEEDIMVALHDDLRKSEFESYASEIGILYPEIKHAAANLRNWARPERSPLRSSTFSPEASSTGSPMGSRSS